MSPSAVNKFHKYLIFASMGMLCFAAPQTVLGITVQFEKNLWELKPTIVDYAHNYVTPLTLENAAKKFLTREPENPNSIFDSKTLIQIEEIAAQVNQPPLSARFIQEDNRAVEFEPGQNGQSLDVARLYQELLTTKTQVPLPVFVSLPAVRLAATNSLGITELVATGESDFSGSPGNRLVNIRVGAKKFNGLILKPNEEFSFNKYLGDVDEANGFLPELVIKKTGLTPELGGGLCQVSSTTFRAAMNAGLPILERRNHSFAVKYYAPQGTDATIYPGSTDLRFTNNFSGHLLIRTRVEKTKLYFDFYGTKDERQITFEGPVQYDQKPDGSMKATWSRTVILAGEEKTQTFRSTYLPPELFTKTIESSIPNPDSAPTPPTT